MQDFNISAKSETEVLRRLFLQSSREEFKKKGRGL